MKTSACFATEMKRKNTKESNLNFILCSYPNTYVVLCRVLSR